MKLSCYNTSFWYLLPNLKKNKIKSYIEEICNEIDGGEEEKKKISEYYKHLVIDRYGLKYTPPNYFKAKYQYFQCLRSSGKLNGESNFNS